jgi:hypothetical protein
VCSGGVCGYVGRGAGWWECGVMVVGECVQWWVCEYVGGSMAWRWVCRRVWVGEWGCVSEGGCGSVESHLSPKSDLKARSNSEK